MPQLRSFTGFASTPGVGSAFVGGMNARNEQQRNATQYAIASMENATRREALMQEALAKNQAIEAEKKALEMRLEAQREQLKAETMIKDQELEIDRFYKTGMLGLNTRQTEVEEKKIAMSAEEAAREYARQEKMRRDATSYEFSGEADTKEEANRMAFNDSFASLPPDIQAKIMDQGGSGGQRQVPTAQDVPGAPGYKALDSGQSWQFIKDVPEGGVPTAKPIPGDLGYNMVGNKRVESPELREFNKIEKRKEALEKALSGDDYHAHVKALMIPLDERTKNDNMLVDAFNKEQEKVKLYDNELAKLKAKMEAAQSGGATNKIVIKAIRPAQR